VEAELRAESKRFDAERAEMIKSFERGRAAWKAPLETGDIAQEILDALHHLEVKVHGITIAWDPPKEEPPEMIDVGLQADVPQGPTEKELEEIAELRKQVCAIHDAKVAALDREYELRATVKTMENDVRMAGEQQASSAAAAEEAAGKCAELEKKVERLSQALRDSDEAVRKAQQEAAEGGRKAGKEQEELLEKIRHLEVLLAAEKAGIQALHKSYADTQREADALHAEEVAKMQKQLLVASERSAHKTGEAEALVESQARELKAAQLEADVAKKQAQASELTIAALQAEISELHVVADAAKAAQRVEVPDEGQAQRIRDLEAQVHSLMIQVSDARHELAGADKGPRLAAAEQKNEELRVQVSQLTSQVQRMTEQNDQFQQLSVSHEALKEELLSVRGKFAQEGSDARLERMALQQDRDQLAATVEDLQGRQTTWEKQKELCEGFEAEARTTRAELSEAREELNKLRQEPGRSAELGEELIALRAELAKKSQEAEQVQELQNEVDELVAQNDELQRQADAEAEIQEKMVDALRVQVLALEEQLRHRMR